MRLFKSSEDRTTVWILPRSVPSLPCYASLLCLGVDGPGISESVRCGKLVDDLIILEEISAYHRAASKTARLGLEVGR